MARFLFFTFDGGGNHPPTIGIATELKQRGHAVTVAGYESQRRRFEEAGLSFVTLPRSGSFVLPVGVGEMEMRMALARGVIANPDHLLDVPELAKGHDAMVVDTGLHMAIDGASFASNDTGLVTRVMADFKDYYRLLRVGPTADDAAIKAAFRRLARRHHPDVAMDPRSARRFPDILEAYEWLSDPEKRRHYDRVYRDRRPASRPRGSSST